MGRLVRFNDPKIERAMDHGVDQACNAMIQQAAKVGKDGRPYADDLVCIMARTVYQMFYTMSDHMSPSEVMENIGFFEQLMETNLPTVRNNVWREAKTKKWET